MTIGSQFLCMEAASAAPARNDHLALSHSHWWQGSNSTTSIACKSSNIRKEFNRADVGTVEFLQEELEMLEQQGSQAADHGTYIRLLRACSRCGALAEGKRIHHHVSNLQLEKDLFIGSQLIQMYLECGSVDGARVAFSRMNQNDVESWNAVIAAFARNGHYNEALQLFERMKQVGSAVPNQVTLVTVLNVLKLQPNAQSLAAVYTIHAEIAKNRKEVDLFAATALMDLYGKCGNLQEAQRLFNMLRFKDTISWSTIIAAYAQTGHLNAALALFRKMQLEGTKPNQIVFVNILNAFTRPKDIAEGRHVHSLITQCNLQRKVILATALIGMYGRCGCLEDAQRIFRATHPRDVVVWNAIIGAYARSGHPKEALKLLQEVLARSSGSIVPNRVTFITILSGFNSPEALTDGMLVHEEIKRRGFASDVVVATALVNMYGKCGKSSDARRIFDSLEKKNVVSWNAMISAYAQNGGDEEALLLFHRMQLEGITPNKITFATVLDACANLTGVVEGKKIHACVSECGYESDYIVGTAIVDMYGKCGSLKDAHGMFERMPQRDIVLWSALIDAYSQHGDRMKAIKLFHQMQQEGVKPGDVAFLGLLSACRHAGLVEEGCSYFASITSDHGLEVTAEQFGCMVDLLARAGWLAEAEELMSKVPSQGDDISAWMALLDACKRQRDVERGKRAAERILEMDPKNSAAYVVLANVYAADEYAAAEEAATLSKLMVDRGIKDKLKKSKVNGFALDAQEICADLESLSNEMEDL